MVEVGRQAVCQKNLVSSVKCLMCFLRALSNAGWNKWESLQAWALAFTLMYTSLALSAITFLSHLWTKWCEMLWYIKYICESSATGVCFPGFYMVVFNALVKKAKKILAFCLLERLDGQTTKQWVATDHQTCLCQWHSVPGWQIIYHDCHKNTVMSAALVSCTYSTVLECQGWTHTALQRSCPLPKRVGWLAAGIMSPDPYRKQAKPPKNTGCSTSVLKEHPPLGAIHQPKCHDTKDYLILYTDLTKNAWFNYFGNAWQTHVSWVFWVFGWSSQWKSSVWSYHWPGSSEFQQCQGKHSCIWFGFAVVKEAYAEAQN